MAPNYLKVLAIDDEEENLDIVKTIVENAFPNVGFFPALTGRKGIALALAEDPDVILLDIVMPKMDGFEVCRRLKADTHLKNIPVVFLTASRADDESRIKCLEVGGAGFLIKPLKEAEFIAQIRAMAKIKGRNAAQRREKERLAILLEGRTNSLEQEVARHKQTEKVLRESEAKYRTLYESSQDALMTIFPPDWLFTTCNSATVRMFRAKNSEEFTSVAPWVVSPEYQSDGEPSSIKAKRMIETAMKKGSYFFDWTHKKMGGEDFPATVLLTKIELGGKAGLQATVRDVTGQKLAEEALKKERQYNRDLINTAQTIILLLDPEGRIVDFNPFMENLSGYRLEEVKGKDWFETFLRKDSGKTTRELFQKAINGMQTKGNTDYIITKDGRELAIEWYDNTLKDSNGRVEGLLSVGQDVTERMRTDKALRFANMVLSTQAETSLDGILVVDGEGKNISVNQRFTEMWGIPLDIVKSGSDARAFQLVADKLTNPEEFYNKVKHLYEFKKKISREEIVLKDGRFFDCYSAPMLDEGGNYFGRVWYFRDITESKRAGELVRESETRYRMLFDQAHDSILMLEIVPDGIPVIRDANVAAQRMHGYSRKEIIGKPISFLDADAMAGVLGERADKIYNAGEAAFEAQHRRKDGSVFDIEVSVKRIAVGGKRLLLDISRDITERKRERDALHSSETRYRRLFEAMQDGILILDSETGVIVDVNPFLVDLLGLSHKQFLNMKIWEIGAFRDIVANQDKFAELQSRGYVRYEGLPLITADGREINVEFVSNIYQAGQRKVIQCSIRDNTKRKQAEAEISEAFYMQGVLNVMLQCSLANTPLREKLNNHLAGLVTLPWLGIQPKGAIFLMNPSGNALVLTVHQGLAPALLSACARVPMGQCLCGKVAQTGQVVESTEVGADHSIRYEGIVPHGHYCAPIIAGNKPLGVLNLYLKEGVSLTDIQRRFIKSVTDIVAESILHAQTEEKLAQSQKMEAVGLLAGGIAHDFNNILTAIKCYAELVSNALLSEDPKREDMREIMSAAERATTLTRQLLAFSRRQILSPRIIDMNKIVSDMTNMLQRIIGEDIKLSTRLKPLPCLTMVDPGQIEQVIMNLVINSRDAMPKGGSITLKTDVVISSDDELSAAHPELLRGSLVCLKVCDTGCGMTEEVKEHVFEPFYTTKEQGKGTGLGLSMIYGIIKQSNGEIEFESVPGKGTTFSVWLPNVENTVPEMSSDIPNRMPGTVSETILFVEDEDSLRRLGERVLTAKGYKVISALNAAEALAALEKHGKAVDLLVTDVVMPGMNGHELAKEIAHRKMAVRTLYMSGYTEDAIAEHGALEPGLAFIYKPFTVDALVLKLREVLDGPSDMSKA